MAPRARWIRVATAAAVAILVVACGEAEDPTTSPDGAETDTGAADGATDESGEDTSVDETTDGEGDDDSPSADPAAVEEPCAEHEGRDQDVFIDLVAPVDDQQVSGAVEIVGCANVFEATVQWRLLDGDGVTLDEGFTTATCGTGCVGEFRDEVPLDAAASEATAQLQVFWESPQDGSERDLVERIIVLD